MNRDGARWSFWAGPVSYGVRVELCRPEHAGDQSKTAVAIIGQDWDAARIGAALLAVEAQYEALPEPTEET